MSMSWKHSLLAGVVGAAAWVGTAQAEVQVPGWFGHIEGIWATGSNGTAISSGNPVIGAFVSTTPGPGSAVAGRIGFRPPGPWDGAIGFYSANLGDGPHIGPPPVNEWSITNTKVLSIDGEVGFNQTLPWGGLRTFGGVRFQQVRHAMGYHPDAPLNCCFNNTTGTGFGPRAGFDVAIPWTPNLSLIGGLDAAVLFGNVTSVGGPTVGSGTVNRTMYNVGARIGLDWAIPNMPPWHLAIGWRVDLTNGTFFTQEGFVSVPHPAPAGVGNRIVQGAFLRLAYNFR